MSGKCFKYNVGTRYRSTRYKMSRQSSVLFLVCFVSIVINIAAAKVPSVSPWANYIPKAAYSRSLGPPPLSGLNTISVPYMPKSPFFPKFVDPNMIISKKTDMLSNLFGGSKSVPNTINPTFLATNDINKLLSNPSLLQSQDDSSQVNNLPGEYKRALYGSVNPKFDFMNSKFQSVSSYPNSKAMPKFNTVDARDLCRRRRSLNPFGDSSDATLGNDKATDDDLCSLSAENDDKKILPESASKSSNKLLLAPPIKEYLPSMFGLFGMDPSMFIAKKATFLDALFKNIATSTPATTDVPETKSTIVPADFWLPKGIIPDPTEYDEKVATFLDKLFDSLKLNITNSGANTTETRLVRSIQDLSSITTAKNTIVDTILAELGDLKSDMINTFNDLIAYQKTTATSMGSKKPLKPFSSIWLKPSADTTLPFSQKIAVLSQMFDMLTNLQKNVSASIDAAIKSNLNFSEDSKSSKVLNVPLVYSNDALDSYTDLLTNETLLEAIKKKLPNADTVDSISNSEPFKDISLKNTERSLPSVATSFWVAYPDSEHSVSKRQVSDDDNAFFLNKKNNFDYRRSEKNKAAAKIRKYLPTDDTSFLFEHQEEGNKFHDIDERIGLKKWIDWIQYYANKYKEHRRLHHY